MREASLIWLLLSMAFIPGEAVEVSSEAALAIIAESAELEDLLVAKITGINVVTRLDHQQLFQFQVLDRAAHRFGGSGGIHALDLDAKTAVW
jgi:hypothetical protein